MDTYWFNKLLNVLMVQTNSENEKLMVLHLDKELRKLKCPYYIDAAGNIIVTKGKAKTYPCVTSHMDTVHSFVDNFKIYKDIDDEDVLFALNGKKRTGIGGDDKCGVFACLHLLEIIPQIKVVFFSREEVGCKGSTAINKEFFADCRYLIQLDRKGSRDFIQTYWGNKTISHDFSSEIGLTKKKYRYKNCIGSVTDVMRLWDNKIGISCINLSCGYYKPHTDYEYISISKLWHSVKFTEEIINTMKPKRYTSLPPVSTVTNVPYATGWTPKYIPCAECKQYKKEALLYNYKGKKLCWSCKKKHYSDKEWQDRVSNAAANPSHNSVLTDNETDKGHVHFACTECGIKPEEMEPGNKLKSVNGKLYCTKCASIFFVFDKEPVKCFVCNKVIPKDHKIIERFGVRVCEDCTCPSDTIILEG